DAPNYAFRGAMLDVARHFFTIQEVKRYIDLLAYYKINILHLHLTDDQGWRIEIKKWP
ncbi:MAG TPA: beta-N-acetylhexosaminidase, partial [Flavobacteriaceae bacterium]|nr:beta-N-acetylhexosaminidase [Flavobacteriaceae bacterium]